MALVDGQQLALFEQHCEKLYMSPDANERQASEAALVQLSSSVEYIPQCQFVLDNSKMPCAARPPPRARTRPTVRPAGAHRSLPGGRSHTRRERRYAQLVAANALKKLLLQSWNQLTVAQRLEFRNYVLTYLYNHGTGAQPFVSASLVQLVGRMTKLGWLDDQQHQQIVTEVSKFLHATPLHLVLALQLLHQLVTEMNGSANTRSLTHHRKVAGSFRDLSLLPILQIALTTLQQLKAGAVQASADEAKRVQEEALTLVLACLGYDFIGTTLDEASEEMGTIQLPSSWRATMEETGTMALFFELYAASAPPSSSLALECLVFLASLRRSLFSSEEERQSFLNRLVRGTLDILRSQQGLTHHANYHEMCRLLARLKANYQLSELVASDAYAEWISIVATFTIDSFNHWQWAANSVYYLLSLWSRLVASMPYLKGDTPSQLESFVPQVITAFINSRMELVRTLLRDDHDVDLDDPLKDEEHLTEQLETLPSLCRFQLQQVASYVMSLFEPSAQLYQQALQTGAAERASNAEVRRTLAQCEGELAWLVYIVATVLGSHLTPNSNSETQQLVDGDLTCAVLQLLPLLDNPEYVHERRLEESNVHLDLAVLFFLQQFRKVYVGEQATSSSKVYVRLGERLHLTDHLAVLSVLVNKIVSNLKHRSECAEVTEKTLALFSDLAGGYCSGKLLLKIDHVHLILANHTAEEFPFLAVEANFRLRTTFYSTLCKLLFSDENTLKFKTFVQPFTQLLTQLMALSDAEFAAPAVRTALIGLLRDLRGVVMACANRRTYTLFFEWIYPAFTPLLQRACVAYFAQPDVTTPLLKLYSELVYNKAQRLTFDSSSPNGILLFRDASQVIVSYGTRVLEHPLPAGADPYRYKHKGISLCMLLLTRALSGNYVNFGVFALYGDRALSDCLQVTINLCLCISLDDIMAYTKVSKGYFTLLELLMRNHAAMIVELGTPVLKHICLSLQEGLKSYEVAISSQCAAALEHLAAFHFRTLTEEREAPAKAQLAAHLAAEPQLFSAQLEVLLHMIVFEDCPNQWSLSRPLLALILTNDAFYAQWRGTVLQQQASSPERQAKLGAAFEKLMAEVQPTLEAKNRDKFTQNLTLFRHDVKNLF